MKNFTRIIPLLIAAIVALSGVAHAQSVGSLTQMLSSVDGSKTSIADLAKGKVTIVSFWATWCGPCKKEMAAMQPIYEKLKSEGRNVQYIAISIDDTKSMARVAPYINARKYTFPVLLDPSKEVFNALAGTNVPFTLIFAADGSLHSRHESYLEGDEDHILDEVTQLEAAAAGTTDDSSAQ